MASERQSGSVPQSRIGKKPVQIPKGVQVQLEQQRLQVKGPKGTLERAVPPGARLELKNDVAVVVPTARDRQDGKRIQGLVRALLASMVKGVSEGYATALDLYGLGYRAELKEREYTR